MSERIRVELELDPQKGIVKLRDFDNKLEATLSGAGRSGRAADQTGRQFNQMGRHIEGAGRRAASAGSLFRQLAGTLGVAFSVQAVINWGKEVHEAHSTFQRDLNMVSTMLDRNALGQENYTRTLEQYRGRLQDLSVEFGESTATLSKGLYDILSASVAPTKALDVLEVSSRAARAGFTDTAVSVDFITSALNAYGKSAFEAGRISDIAFATVARGKTTFPELAGAIGQVAPTAAAAGIALEQLMAMLANVTRQGVNTNMAVTAINALLVQFSRGSKEASEAWAGLQTRLGVARTEFGVARLQGDELFKTLELLSRATDKERIAILQEVNALKAANALAQDSKGLREDLNKVMNAQGQTQEALNKRKGESEEISKRLDKAYTVLETTIGDKLAPSVNRAKESFTGLLMVLNSSIKSGSFGQLFERMATGFSEPLNSFDAEAMIARAQRELKQLTEISWLPDWYTKDSSRAKFLRERIVELREYVNEAKRVEAIQDEADAWAAGFANLAGFPTPKGTAGATSATTGLTDQEKAQAKINAAVAKQQDEYIAMIAATVDLENQIRRAGMTEHERQLDDLRIKYEQTYQAIDDMVLAGVITEERASDLAIDAKMAEGLAYLEAERGKSEALGREALKRQGITEKEVKQEKSLFDLVAESYGDSQKIVKDTTFNTLQGIQGGFQNLFRGILRGDINDFNDFFGAAGDVTVDILTNVASQMASGFLMKGISPMIGGVGDLFSSLLGGAGGAGMGFLNIMGPTGWMITGGIAAAGILALVWDDFGEDLLDGFESIGESIIDIFESIVQAASDAVGSVTGIFDGIGSIFDAPGDLIGDIGDSIGGLFDIFHQGGKIMHEGGSLGPAPVVAHSGMFMGRKLAADEIPVIAQRGEAITQRSSVTPETWPVLDYINRNGRVPQSNSGDTSLTANITINIDGSESHQLSFGGGDVYGLLGAIIDLLRGSPSMSQQLNLALDRAGMPVSR